MIDVDAIIDVAHGLARGEFPHHFGRPEREFRESPVWQRVRALGTRLWLDTGDVEAAESLWCSEFEALTTNNTLLNKEIQKGLYDDLIAQATKALREAAPDIESRELIQEIAFVLNARHGLKLVERFDAHVSVELHTDLGDDVNRSVAYGKRFFDICPERFYVKVPLTPAGLLAARKLGQFGIPVNLTLGFSARQNYLAALIAQPRFLNVFMGRLGAFVVDNALGDGCNVGEKVTLATQRQLNVLRQEGRTRSLLIGASMRGESQVAALAGLDVFTMPLKVASQYADDPAEEIASQLQSDPPVELDERGEAVVPALWEVPEAFTESVEGLLKVELDTLTPEAIQSHLKETGWGDLFPAWSEQDLATMRGDGKIPVFSRWRKRLVSGEIGLDALMNASAFMSFATDQKALDDRISSLT